MGSGLVQESTVHCGVNLRFVRERCFDVEQYGLCVCGGDFGWVVVSR